MSTMEIVLRSIAPEYDVFNSEREWAPEVNITEDAEIIVVSTELPGMNRDDIEIDIVNGVLKIVLPKEEKALHRKIMIED